MCFLIDGQRICDQGVFTTGTDIKNSMEMQKMDGYTGAVARSMHNSFTRKKKFDVFVWYCQMATGFLYASLIGSKSV